MQVRSSLNMNISQTKLNGKKDAKGEALCPIIYFLKEKRLTLIINSYKQVLEIAKCAHECCTPAPGTVACVLTSFQRLN